MRTGGLRNEIEQFWDKVIVNYTITLTCCNDYSIQLF